jgi:hypothetical protein
MRPKIELYDQDVRLVILRTARYDDAAEEVEFGEISGSGRRLLLEYRLDSDVAVIKVTGEVDLSTCGPLRDGLLRVITDENRAGRSSTSPT